MNQLEKARLIALFEDGVSLRRIAEQFGKPRSTIQSLRTKWENTGSLERRAGSGRKKISNENQDNDLIDFLRNNPFQTAVEAHNQTNFPGTVRTARNRIKKNSELRNKVAAKKPFLTDINKEQRMGFALEYLPQGMNFWEKVVFTDEKTFQSYYNGQLRVYRPPNTRYEERYTQHVKTSGRFSVNVWGYMTSRGLGICHRIRGRFNTQAYIHILQNVMLPSVNNIFQQENFIYQHDNCPVHTARRVSDWIRENNISLLPWPSRSPDINPIENVWGYIVKEINKNNDFHLQNSDDLWNKIEETWNTYNLHHAQMLVASMPRRLNLLVEKNGAALKY